MKNIYIIVIIALLQVFGIRNQVHAQPGDGGSGWANWVMNQIEWARAEIRDNAAIAKTIELVKLYQETKQLTGVVASTVTDLKNATLKFQTDVQTIDDVSQSQLDQLNDYFSFSDALSGKNYPSLLNLEQWYTDEFATFRDKEGHLNVATWLFNTVSLEDQIKNQRAYYAQLYKIQGQKGIYVDKEISRLLFLAKEYDNQARHLIIKLNLTVFNKSLSNVSSGLGKVFKADNSKDNSQKTKRSDEEIQAEIDRVYDLQDKAARARGEALGLLYEKMQADMSSMTIDLLAWRRLQPDLPSGKKNYNIRELPVFEIPDGFGGPKGSVDMDF